MNQQQKEILIQKIELGDKGYLSSKPPFQKVSISPNFQGIQPPCDDTELMLESIPVEKETTQLGFIAKDEGRAIGYAMGYYNPEDKAAFIDDIFVTPEYQGKGVESRLIQSCAGHFNDKGAEKMYMPVQEGTLSNSNGTQLVKTLQKETRAAKMMLQDDEGRTVLFWNQGDMGCISTCLPKKAPRNKGDCLICPYIV